MKASERVLGERGWEPFPEGLRKQADEAQGKPAEEKVEEPQIPHGVEGKKELAQKQEAAKKSKK